MAKQLIAAAVFTSAVIPAPDEGSYPAMLRITGGSAMATLYRKVKNRHPALHSSLDNLASHSVLAVYIDYTL
jgi:hypothetical protein